MKRGAVLIICVAALMLTACSKRTPEVSAETTAPATTTAPTTTTSTSTSGFGGTSGTSEPTTEPTDDGMQSYTVKRGTLEDIFSFKGKIAPLQASLFFEQEGVIKKVFVKPGETIARGDLVAQLDTEDLQSQLNEAKLASAQAQRSIDQAAQAAQLEVKQAEIAFEAAQQDLAQAKEPPTDVAIAQAETAIREAQANLETVRNNASQAKNQAKADMDKAVVDLQNAQNEYSETLAKRKKAKDDTEKKDLDDKIKELAQKIRDGEAAIATAVINYDTARNNEAAAVKDAEAKLDLTKTELEALLKGTDKFVIAEKERAVRSAQIAVDQAHQRATTDPSLTNAVEASRLQVKQIEEQIAARQLYAPINGEIISVDIKAGDAITVDTPVMTLGDMTKLEIVADSADMISDARPDLPELTTSQVVEITFSRYPGKTFTGTLNKPEATTTADGEAIDTSSTYRFTFNTQDLSFASGDEADLKIVLERKENALYLPPEAINDNSNVMLRDGESDSRVDIEVGIITPDKVEILDGLKEGDVVVVEK